MRLAIAPVLALISMTPLVAQDTTATATAVPRLVRFTGTFHAANGLPVGSTESATLSVYAEEHGGTPLWQETQNVAMEADGHYTAMLGATQNDGVPLDLFTASSPRWLGVMFNRPGETEQPRVQLVSVPYAMRAVDAETLGGRPASSYLLDPNAPATGSASAGNTASTASSASAKSVKPRLTSQQNNFPIFSDTSGDLGGSVMYQSGSNVGVGTSTPAAALNVFSANSSPSLTSDTAGMLLTTSNSLQLALGGLAAGPYSVWLQTKQSFNSGNSYPIALNPLGGNIGIGTTIPQNRLDVGGAVIGTLVGNATVGISSASGNSILGLGQAASNRGRLAWVYNTTPASAYMALGVTNGTNPLVLQDMGGNVGIGATPSYKLDVAGDINFSGIVRQGGSPAFSTNSTYFNTAIGSNALAHVTPSQTQANFNTAIGSNALFSDTTGGSNTAIGTAALTGNVTGNNNIAIGYNAGAGITESGSNNIDIGATGNTTDSGIIRIGTVGNQTSFYVQGVSGVNLGTSDTTMPVLIDLSTGQLGTSGTSSRRYKEDIQDMGDTSSGLMRLRPVTFRYKEPANDGSKPVQYGLIAEEVAEVYPDLVVHSADGQIEGVKYQVLDSLLLNEVQKQQHQIGQQQEHIQKLEEQNQALQERLERLESALAAGGSR